MHNKRFLNIIYDKKLCLSENPYGVDILWPKSYAELYYEKKMDLIYLKNKSPNILEINQQSNLRNKIWNNFYIKPLIKICKIENHYGLNKYKSYLGDFNFDIIIVNNSANINNLNYLIRKLNKILKNDGLIIIENINSNMFMMSKIFLSYQCKIFDFRLHKFTRNNCLVEIQKSIFFDKTKFLPLNLLRFGLYIFNSLIVLLIIILTTTLKRFNF